MPLPDDIRAAAAAGIVNADQAERLVEFLNARADALAPPADAIAIDAEEEAPRFLRSFQDVFLTIGIVLLLAGVSILGHVFLHAFGGVLVGAAVAYVLAIGFARRRRLVLPSMALALGFVVLAGFGVFTLAAGDLSWGEFRDVQGIAHYAFLAGAIASVVAAAVFYLSFRLPFALGTLALGVVAVLEASLALAGPMAFSRYFEAALLACGLLTFATAMAFDLSDPLRRTLRADNAFWLHLAAAPMIVHAVISLLVGLERMPTGSAGAVKVVLLVALLALIAVIIDRRALFVSALSYFGIAVAVLIRHANLNDTGGIATTLVIIGACVIGLGVGWHRIRTLLLSPFPRRGILLRLPPVRNVAS